MQKFGNILVVNEGDIFDDRMHIKNLGIHKYHRKLYELIQKENK